MRSAVRSPITGWVLAGQQAAHPSAWQRHVCHGDAPCGASNGDGDDASHGGDHAHASPSAVKVARTQTRFVQLLALSQLSPLRLLATEGFLCRMQRRLETLHTQQMKQQRS